jgi:hypothetical protein
VFHAAAACLAVLVQLGKGKRAWKSIWIIPVTYAIVAGIEAVMAGSIIGVM